MRAALRGHRGPSTATHRTAQCRSARTTPPTRAEADGRWWFFDCYNGGRILSDEEVAALHKIAPQEAVRAASTKVITDRVLRNLASAFYENGQADTARMVLKLIEAT